MPWDDSQVKAYGPSFAAWTDTNLELALAAIKDACPFSELCFVVCLSSLSLLQVYHSLAQRDFVRKLLHTECQSVNDFVLYKVGTLILTLIPLDASHSGHTAYCPSFEMMTVAMKSVSMRPHFSGPPSRLSHQSRQNLIAVNSLKRGGFRVPGSKTPLNPNEKPMRANGWLISSWTVQGVIIVSFSLLVGNTVLSLCGGSASLMEACMLAGRSCIMFEIDGMISRSLLLSEKQFEGAKLRMDNTLAVIKSSEEELAVYFLIFLSASLDFKIHFLLVDFILFDPILS